jgi:hypothetical protein
VSEPPAQIAWGVENIGILAYGSLLGDPGPELGPHIIDRIPHKTPWPVEYARSSESRGGGPTLVIHPRGSPVQGAVMVLDIKRSDIDLAREWLRRRERTSEKYIETTNAAGLEVVLYARLPPNIKEADLRPDRLAEFAIESVAVKPDRNGIRYLADNIKNGITTPLTEAYRIAVLSKLKAQDLEAAERIAKYKSRNRPSLLSWRKVFWLAVAALFWLPFSSAFRAKGSLHVQIVERGRNQLPIPDADLELISEGDDSTPIFKPANDQGLLNVGNVRPGPYQVKVRASGFVG